MIAAMAGTITIGTIVVIITTDGTKTVGIITVAETAITTTTPAGNANAPAAS